MPWGSMVRAVFAVWVPMAVAFGTGRRELALLPRRARCSPSRSTPGGPLLGPGEADRHVGALGRRARAAHRHADLRAGLGRGHRGGGRGPACPRCCRGSAQWAPSPACSFSSTARSGSDRSVRCGRGGTPRWSGASGWCGHSADHARVPPRGRAARNGGRSPPFTTRSPPTCGRPARKGRPPRITKRSPTALNQAYDAMLTDRASASGRSGGTCT